MKISQKELTMLLTKGASKVVEAEAAEYFARESIETHLRKVPRNNPIKSSVTDLLTTLKRQDSEIEYKVDLGASLVIDFHGHGPLVYLKDIHDKIENRANSHGLAMMAFTNSQGLHTLHVWVQGLAKRGLVSLVLAN